MNSRNVSEFDGATAKVYYHLKDTLDQIESDPNVAVSLDSHLLNNFSRILSNNKSIIFGDTNVNNTSLVKVDECQFLITFIPLLSRLLEFPHLQDSENDIIDLLVTILSHLTFDQIQVFFSEDFIVRGIESEDANVINLVITILTSKLNDNGTVEFLAHSEVLTILIEKYLTIKSDVSFPLSVVSNVEKLVSGIIDARLNPLIDSKLFSPQLIKLYQATRQRQDSILTSRLLDYVVILVPFLDSYQQRFPFSIYTFSDSSFDDSSDPLFPLIVIQFYTNFVNKLVLEANTANANVQRLFSSIEDPINDIVKLYSTRNTNTFVDSFYSTAIVELIATLSYSSLKTCQVFISSTSQQHGLLKSYNIYLDKESDIRLLSKINYNVFDDQTLDDFYSDNLSELSLFGQKYFTILLNSIKNPQLFKLISTDSRNYLSTEKISRLAADQVYYVLLQISKYHHSKSFLIDHLPNLINDYIVNSPYVIVNNEIWNLKLQVLSNLIHSEDETNLKVWKTDLVKTYSLMKNGKQVKSQNPQVDVADDTV